MYAFSDFDTSKDQAILVLDLAGPGMTVTVDESRDPILSAGISLHIIPLTAE